MANKNGKDIVELQPAGEKVKAGKRKADAENSCVSKSERRRAQRKVQRERDRDARQELDRLRYAKNKEKILDGRKQHYAKNRDVILDGKKQHYAKNRDVVLEGKKRHNAAKSKKKRQREDATRVDFTNTDSTHTIAMEPSDNTVNRHFLRHQDCPEANTILNHITTYRNHFTEDPSDPVERERLKEKIRAQVITPEKQKELAERFLAAQGRGCEWSDGKKEFVERRKSRDAPLFSCACCGYRDMDMLDDSPKRTYKSMYLEDLDALKVDGDDLEEHLKRLYAEDPSERMTMRLPSNGDGDLRTYELWRAWSIWPQHEVGVGEKNHLGHNNCFYHLHPELVEAEESRAGSRGDGVRYKAMVCGVCSAVLESKGDMESRIPPLSLKAGVDYGSPDRVGLEDLSLMERHIISKVRHFAQVFKISSNTGRQREHTQSVIKGHSICFEHDSPRVCSGLLSPETIKEDIVIHFVGPDGEHDKLLQKVKNSNSSHLHARAYVVYQWLAALKKVGHPLYQDEPELPSLESIQSTIDEAVESLLEESINTFDSKAQERSDIKRDDVAGIRATSIPDCDRPTSTDGMCSQILSCQPISLCLTGSDRPSFHRWRR